MDMSASMASMTPASTADMSMSTGMSMGGMGGMDMGSGKCKISMLWNWYTVDACFLASSWHVTSRGMFAGSCIGVICLVTILEFLRRVQREFDKSVALRPAASNSARKGYADKVADSFSEGRSPESPSSTEKGRMSAKLPQEILTSGGSRVARPTLLQQMIRATIHMLQFAVAYFIMLLAMYYNGYIIICIFIGAWIGAFAFSWDQLGAKTQADASEVTGCCG